MGDYILRLETELTQVRQTAATSAQISTQRHIRATTGLSDTAQVCRTFVEKRMQRVCCRLALSVWVCIVRSLRAKRYGIMRYVTKCRRSLASRVIFLWTFHRNERGQVTNLDWNGRCIYVSLFMNITTTGRVFCPYLFNVLLQLQRMASSFKRHRERKRMTRALQIWIQLQKSARQIVRKATKLNARRYTWQLRLIVHCWEDISYFNQVWTPIFNFFRLIFRS